MKLFLDEIVTSKKSSNLDESVPNRASPESSLAKAQVVKRPSLSFNEPEWMCPLRQDRLVESSVLAHRTSGQPLQTGQDS